jgi:DNA-binding response OmpR family regulator
MKIKKNTGEIEYPALKDLRVLQLLVKKAPEAVSRDQILDEVWGPDKELNHRTVDNTIVRLKKILGDEKDQLIRSVRGVGYQWIYENK